MGTPNELGLVVPAGSDAFDPQGDMVTLAATARGRVIVPVPNQTAADALQVALAPSAGEPLMVRLGDSGVIRVHAGAGWVTVADPTAVTPYRTASGLGTRVFAGTASGVFTGSFPAGRFTQPPAVFFWCPNPGFGAFFSAEATSTTAWQAQGHNGSPGVTIPYRWFAFQQTPTSALG